jgi:endonuclease/exonuclease/phosphatase family metal-dependent hydrolase
MLFRFLALAFLSLISAHADDVPLKVMSFNIHHGAGLDGKIDLPRIAAVIKAQDPDVVVLQEVDREATRSGKIDQAKVIGELTGLHAVFGEAMPLQGGSYGQALLSKHPIEFHRVLRLSLRDKNEPRIGISARILHPVQPFTAVGVHLDYQKIEWRLAECEQLVAALKTTEGPVVIGGDFNAIPECPSLVPLTPAWTRVAFPAPSFTFPANEPKKEIDHFYFRNLPAPTQSVILDEKVASDHRPIVVTFPFPKP